MTAHHPTADEWPGPTCCPWHCYLDGWTNGHAAGLETGLDRGRRLEHDDVAAIQRHAAGIVHAAAKLPAHDPEETAARRARIDARFRGDAA